MAGSGVFYEVGRTIVFGDHADVYAHFVGRYNGWDPSGGNGDENANVQVAQAARAKGFDTIQYMHHMEYGIYGHEILDVRDSSYVQRGPCPGPTLKKYIFAGWNGSVGCQCSEMGGRTGYHWCGRRVSLLDTHVTEEPIPGFMKGGLFTAAAVIFVASVCLGSAYLGSFRKANLRTTGYVLLG